MNRSDSSASSRRSTAWVLVLLIAPLARAEDTLDARITIEPQVVKRNLDPHDYCCANWVWTTYTHTLRHIFADPARRRDLARFLHDDVSIRTIRYPAGGNVQYLHFGIPGSRFVEQMRKTDPPARPDDWIEIEEFFRFLDEGDLRTFLQVNTLSWYDDATGKSVSFIPTGATLPLAKEKLDLKALAKAADRVERMAEWVREKKYDRLVRIWELGNEEYGGYSGEAYGAIAAELTRRIKKVLPDARVVVTNQLGVTRDEWKAVHNQFSAGVLKELAAQKLAPQIAGVTNHVYAFAVRTPEGGTVNSTAYQEFAAYTSFLPDDPLRQPWQRLFDRAGRPASLVGKQADDLDAAGFPHADVFVTEYRLGGMQEQYNQALANGLGNLQLNAGFVAAPRVGGTTIHSLLHATAVTRGNADSAGRPRPFGTWGYDVINYQMDDAARPRFVSTPVAEAFNLTWRFARGDVLRSTSSTPLLFCVATREGKALRLLVINRAAQPTNPADTAPNAWGWGDTATRLATASEAGDRFRATISLPKDFSPSENVRAYTLGEGEQLGDRSVDAGTFTVHEVKVKSIKLRLVSPIEYTFAPHSATLLEFGESR